MKSFDAPADDESKVARYARVARECQAILEGIDDPVTAMAIVAGQVYDNVPGTSWAGFYRRVAPGLLRVGPYRGPLPCLEIPFERGVCGAAARERRTQLVPDVHAFPGHIACDEGARSEVVVPILDDSGATAVVLDLDSHAPANFDAEDAAGLESLVATLRARLTRAAEGEAGLR
jgi:L-methionine (R)-S-oxide reductase